MDLKDKIDFYGVFSIKRIDLDGNVIDEYTEKNLITDAAREIMAQSIGGVNSTSVIDKFVLGTKGHVGASILDPQEVGESDPSKPSGDQIFDASRTLLFSESISGSTNYQIPFSIGGGSSEITTADGTRFDGITPGSAEPGNEIERVVLGRNLTYTVTIPVENANPTGSDPAIAYTEAALYAGGNLFSMKTFSGKVKEDTVKFVISWSIIF